MAEWTPEAKEYLDGYLKQVHALANQSTEDGDEIVAGLKEHITEKTEHQAGALVTLDILRLSVSAVGTPEQIVEDGATWIQRDSSATHPEFSNQGITNRVLPTAETLTQPPDRSAKFLRWTFSVILLSLAGLFALMILGYLTVVGLSFVVSMRNHEVQLAQRLCDEIGRAEEEFVKKTPIDVDNDGIPDFGTLQQLYDAKLLPKDFLSSRNTANWYLDLEPKPSSNTGERTYTITIKKHKDDKAALYWNTRQEK